MEKGVGFDMESYMHEVFEMQEVDMESYSPLTLAYIGDSVYDLIIRTLVVNEGNRQVKKLHEKTISMLQPLLSEEERGIYKRGRNAKSVSSAKNQSLTDYRRATGFEALMGWLYLKRDWKRIIDLIKIGLDHLAEMEKE